MMMYLLETQSGSYQALRAFLGVQCYGHYFEYVEARVCQNGGCEARAKAVLMGDLSGESERILNFSSEVEVVCDGSSRS